MSPEESRALAERLGRALKSGFSRQTAELMEQIRELANPPVETILELLMFESGVSRMGEEDDQKYAGRRHTLSFSFTEKSLAIMTTLASLVADFGEPAIPPIVEVVHGKWLKGVQFKPSSHEGIMILLERMGRPILPHLLQWLEGTNRAAAEAAAYTLRCFPEKAVMDALVATNDCTHQRATINLSYVANHSLADMTRSHLNQISEYLRSPNADFRRGVVWALVKSNQADAIPIVIGHYSHETDQGNKGNILELLGPLKDQRAIGLFQTVAAADDSLLRSHATSGLEWLGVNIGTVEKLLQKGTHSDPSIAADSIEALGQHKDPKAVPALLIALTHPTARIRNKALLALGKIGDSRAIEPMLRCLMSDGVDEDQPPGCRLGWYCLEGLGFAVVGPLTQILESPNPNHAANAAEILGEIKATLALPALLKALNSAEWLVRCRAVTAIALIGDDQAKETLQKLSSDPDPRVASEVVLVLSKMKAKKKQSPFLADKKR